MAQRRRNGGLHWGKRFRSLPEAERALIIKRMVLGTYRYLAKRYGLPPPVFYVFDAEQLPDGGIAAQEGSLRPLTEAELDEIFKSKSDT
jgi:hypothetical protein